MKKNPISTAHGVFLLATLVSGCAVHTEVESQTQDHLPDAKADEFSEHAPTPETFVSYFDSCATTHAAAVRHRIALSETETNDQWRVNCMKRVNNWAAPLLQANIDAVPLDFFVEPVADTFARYHAEHHDYCGLIGRQNEDEELHGDIALECEAQAQRMLGRIIVGAEGGTSAVALENTDLALSFKISEGRAEAGQACVSLVSEGGLDPAIPLTNAQYFYIQSCIVSHTQGIYLLVLTPDTDDFDSRAEAYLRLQGVSVDIGMLAGVAASLADYQAGAPLEATLTRRCNIEITQALEYVDWLTDGGEPYFACAL